MGQSLAQERRVTELVVEALGQRRQVRVEVQSYFALA